jgi:hypothetical protein
MAPGSRHARRQTGWQPPWPIPGGRGNGFGQPRGRLRRDQASTRRGGWAARSPPPRARTATKVPCPCWSECFWAMHSGAVCARSNRVGGTFHKQPRPLLTSGFAVGPGLPGMQPWAARCRPESRFQEYTRHELWASAQLMHHGLVKAWLDRRPLWQFALIMWTGCLACCMLALIPAICLKGPPYEVGSAIYIAAAVSVGATVGYVRRRQRRLAAHPGA